MNKKIIKGIAWAHTRGISPLQACSQRFNELNPEIEILWEKRSLQEFGDAPLGSLAQKFDLLVIDHPWVGVAAQQKCILPLNKYLPAAFLNDQREHSVGLSYQSYEYDNCLWALPIDAAAPTASYRADLFMEANRKPPANWEELLLFAEEGKVGLAGTPVDTALHFLMYCRAVGEAPFPDHQQVVSLEKGEHVLRLMKQLWSLCDKEIFQLNPIALAERMSSGDQYWYCPFAFCYSNYSREGYAEKRLTYTDMIWFTKESKLKSVLGGAGLAISSSAGDIEACLKFSQWVASPVIQRTLYAENGGQPGYRSAWESPRLNMLTEGYFADVLPVIDNAFLRPRYNGFLYFQDNAGPIIWEYLLYGGNETAVIGRLNALYVKSLSIPGLAL